MKEERRRGGIVGRPDVTPPAPLPAPISPAGGGTFNNGLPFGRMLPKNGAADCRMPSLLSFAVEAAADIMSRNDGVCGEGGDGIFACCCGGNCGSSIESVLPAATPSSHSSSLLSSHDAELS